MEHLLIPTVFLLRAMESQPRPTKQRLNPLEFRKRAMVKRPHPMKFRRKRVKKHLPAIKGLRGKFNRIETVRL